MSGHLYLQQYRYNTRYSFLPKLSDYIVIKAIKVQNWSYFVVLSFMNDQNKLGIPTMYL